MQIHLWILNDTFEVFFLQNFLVNHKWDMNIRCVFYEIHKKFTEIFAKKWGLVCLQLPPWAQFFMQTQLFIKLFITQFFPCLLLSQFSKLYSLNQIYLNTILSLFNTHFPLPNSITHKYINISNSQETASLPKTTLSVPLIMSA